MNCGDIPPLYVAGFTCLLLGLWLAGKEVKAGGLRSLRAPAGACLFEAFGLAGYRMLVYPAILMIDPFAATNLAHVWIFAALIGALAMAGLLTARHWCAVLLFAAAVATACAGGITPSHVMALSGGLIWAWYVVMRGHVEGAGTKASAIGNMAAGALIIVLAFIAGNRWDFAAGDGLRLIAILLVANGGVVVWEYGARHGATRHSKISVLFAPLMALVAVWIAGGIMPGWTDIAAAAGITAAGLIASPHVFRAVKTAPM